MQPMKYFGIENSSEKGYSVIMMTPEWDEAQAKMLISGFAKLKGGLMEALHGLQNAFGYVDDAALPLLAEAFNLSNAEVYGVRSYYHDFRKAPAGRHVIKICQAESCQAMGSRALTEHARKLLGIELGETNTQGMVTLEAVYCLGNCAISPNIMMDDRVYGRMTADKFDRLLKEAERADV